MRRLPRDNRSHAEDGASEVRGDLMPRADRAGGETLNHGFKARFGFEQQDRDQTLCLVPVLLFNAEDGT